MGQIHGPDLGAPAALVTSGGELITANNTLEIAPDSHPRRRQLWQPPARRQDRHGARRFPINRRREPVG